MPDKQKALLLRHGEGLWLLSKGGAAMSQRKSSSNLALILARIRRLEDGRIDGFVLIRLPGAVALAIIAAVAKYFLG